MSDRHTHPRLPLVYATRQACADAAVLLEGRVLENVVEEAIAACRISTQRGNRKFATVYLNDGLIAIVRRSNSPITGRKSWVTIAVRELARAA